MTTKYSLCAKTQLRFYRYELLWPLEMYDVIASIFYNSYLSLSEIRTDFVIDGIFSNTCNFFLSGT